jgi:hypothetical protein
MLSFLCLLQLLSSGHMRGKIQQPQRPLDHDGLNLRKVPFCKRTTDSNASSRQEQMRGFWQPAKCTKSVMLLQKSIE